MITPSQASPQGLRWWDWRAGRAVLSRACLWRVRDRPSMLFTFSLLSFWWPCWPAVIPLRFVGPRECLPYITPDTTAPDTHTHTHTHTLTHAQAHTLLHTYTLTHMLLLRCSSTVAHPQWAMLLSWEDFYGLPATNHSHMDGASPLGSGGQSSHLLALKSQVP